MSDAVLITLIIVVGLVAMSFILIDATKAFCAKNNRNPCYHYIRLEFHADTDRKLQQGFK